MANYEMWSFRFGKRPVGKRPGFGLPVNEKGAKAQQSEVLKPI